MHIGYLYGAVFILLVIVCWIYAGLIDHMKEHYPDYEGEDFLQEEKPTGKVIRLPEKQE